MVPVAGILTNPNPYRGLKRENLAFTRLRAGLQVTTTSNPNVLGGPVRARALDGDLFGPYALFSDYDGSPVQQFDFLAIDAGIQANVEAGAIPQRGTLTFRGVRRNGDEVRQVEQYLPPTLPPFGNGLQTAAPLQAYVLRGFTGLVRFEILVSNTVVPLEELTSSIIVDIVKARIVYKR